MPILKGKSLSGESYIGKAKIWQTPKHEISFQNISQSQVSGELLRLKNAINKLETDYRYLLQNPDFSQLDKDIINTHLMIVTDIEITQILETTVKNELLKAETAVDSTFKRVIKNFEKLDSNYFAQRADDYKDVSNKLLNMLIGESDDSFSFHEDDILFLHDITPSLVSAFAKAGVNAYCIEHGSYTSHSSILARAYDITAFVLDEEVIEKIKDDDVAIIDSESEVLIINPTSEQLNVYKIKLNKQKEKEALANSTVLLPSETKNGKHIIVKANIDFSGEIQQLVEKHLEGIGLFRTEFIYLNRNIIPDEEEQTRVYSELLQRMNNLPVTIRTFDLGGDKLSFYQQHKPEENPYLGSRGIRFSLLENAMFKTQIRAILRASVFGQVSIMFPMIISTEDFIAGKSIISECMKELDKECIVYNKSIPVGAMIETPSSALCSEHLAKVCAFFSLGTNDLVQYTLAVDRNNDKVSSYYIQHHPSVLMLIKKTLESARKTGIPVSVCGEMASEPKYVPLLIGMGINELSINPSKTAQVKAVIRNCDDSLCELLSNFDFNTDVSSIETLINTTLKPYYTIYQ